jgi:DNA-directed RNA polymerase subunit RPC12/RpoP
MDASEVHCPKCGSTQLVADRKGGGKHAPNPLMSGVSTETATVPDRHRHAIITCRKCGFKFRAGDGPKGVKRGNSETDAEKKVASFMFKMFCFAVAGIVAVFIFLWAIGKFG